MLIFTYTESEAIQITMMMRPVGDQSHCLSEGGMQQITWPHTFSVLNPFVSMASMFVYVFGTSHLNDAHMHSVRLAHNMLFALHGRKDF